ncbi:MAG: exodeoxyribonuclease V subunit gamma [Phycisphaeraceae bacterium]|nr:exodeoxyribonuclease V subunit gamma [Phycisphaeraceae bacterium]
MGIDVYESVSFEALWARFTRDLSVPPSAALARELIVVPARGWETYITRRAALEQGCFAHAHYLALGRWMSITLDDVLGRRQAPDRDADALTWAIASVLPDLVGENAFAPVRAYLDADPDRDPRRLVDLARSIGRRFDEYRLYRPKLIEAWSRGSPWPAPADRTPEHAEWQCRLWAKVNERLPIKSVAALLRDLATALSRDAASLPRRASVWHCGSLPPAHLDFLEAVGRHCEIGLYWLAPSFAYWGDMKDRRELMRLLRDSGMTLRAFCADQHIDLLHPLLGSMGRAARESQILLVDRDTETWRFHDAPPVPGRDERPDRMLASIQRDLHRASEPEPAPMTSVDASLTVHDCHSATREVEVLRDQLRDALESDRSLAPEQVVVMCADLETYAPLIQAVFGGTAEEPDRHIPFHIAGRSVRATRPLVDAFFRILDALQGRLGAGDVLDLLHVPMVAERAGVGDDEVRSFAEWVAGSRIRWGLDADHRLEEKLPETDLNTWRFGLDRLVLGYAMPPGTPAMSGDIVALDRGDGMAAAPIGRLWAFVLQLDHFRDRTLSPRPWPEWRATLCELAERMLPVHRDEPGRQRLFDAIDQIVQVAGDGGFDAAVPLPVAAREIERRLDESAAGLPFRPGGVTFCDLTAMRSLPFKVVAVLGMSDGKFPRVETPIGFDLAPHVDARGDPSPRLEDKQLFLEALLAARERLIVTYQGRDLEDQKARPPSIVVDELLDAIAQSKTPPPDAHALDAEDDQDDRDDSRFWRARLVVRHPLQAFSPRYFDGGERFCHSYEDAACRAATALAGAPKPPLAFAGSVLPAGEDPAEISVRDLRRVVESPWEILLQRVGATVSDFEEIVHEREPLVLDSLERWRAGDTWTRDRIDGTPPGPLRRRLRREGILPAGELGAQTLDDIEAAAEVVVTRATERGGTGRVESKLIRIEIDRINVAGRIEGCDAGAIRRATFSKLQLKHVLRLWVDRLLLSADTAASGDAHMVFREADEVTIPPVDPDEAMGHLQDLVGLYRLARCLPLPFFSESASTVIRMMHKEKLDLDDSDFARRAAYQARWAYEHQRDRKADADRFPVRAAFSGRHPFDMTCAEAPGFESGGREPLFLALFERICRPILRVAPSLEGVFN